MLHGGREVPESTDPSNKDNGHAEHKNSGWPLAVEMETPPDGEVGEDEEDTEAAELDNLRGEERRQIE